MDARRVSRYAFERARAPRLPRLLLPAVLAAVVVIALLAAGSSIASDPSSSSLTVPTAAGQTVVSEWDGDDPAGRESDEQLPGSTRSRTKHDVTINVPAGAYDTVDAAFKFTITWADAANDEILTVVDPQGEEVDSSDGGSERRDRQREQPAAGELHGAGLCLRGAAPVSTPASWRSRPQRARSEPSLPSAPAQGLAFSASVAGRQPARPGRAATSRSTRPATSTTAGRPASPTPPTTPRSPTGRRRPVPPARHAAARPAERAAAAATAVSPSATAKNSRGQLPVRLHRPRAADRLRHFDVAEQRQELVDR